MRGVVKSSLLLVLGAFFVMAGCTESASPTDQEIRSKVEAYVGGLAEGLVRGEVISLNRLETTPEKINIVASVDMFRTDKKLPSELWKRYATSLNPAVRRLALAKPGDKLSTDRIPFSLVKSNGEWTLAKKSK